MTSTTIKEVTKFLVNGKEFDTRQQAEAYVDVQKLAAAIWNTNGFITVEGSRQIAQFLLDNYKITPNNQKGGKRLT